jgi:F0F1-type ATP synthase assembly protein I
MTGRRAGRSRPSEEGVPFVATPPSAWKTVGALSSVGLSFVFAIVIGTWAGYWVDGQLGTKPIGFFVGFVLGLVAGVLNIYRITSAAMKDQ